MQPPVDRERVLEQLARLLSSQTFARADRSSVLLRFLVEHTVDGESDRLKEYTLGAEALGRGPSFDPRTDTIVRAEASRLRTRLERYYESEGRADQVRVLLPKGTYVPQFELRGRSDQVAVAAHDATGTPGRTGWMLGAGLVAALAIAVLGFARTSAPPAVGFYDVELRSDGGILGSQVGVDAILSPDAKRVFFVSRDPSGLAHLHTRRLDRPEGAVRLPGTDGARSIFISPDGRWVGFFSAGKVKKISVDGGAPVGLCDAADLLGASWGRDGSIIAALNSDTRLWRIPESGGDPEPLLDLAVAGARPVWPQIASDGRFVIYTVLSGDADNGTVEILSLADGKRTPVIRGGTFGRLLSNGYLTYVNQGTLFALPFDRRRLAATGSPIPVLDDVSYSRTFGYAQVDISDEGTLLYRKDVEGGLRIVEWIDRSGQASALLPTAGRYSWPRLSPDGRRLALSVTDAGAPAIWIYDPETAGTLRLATTPVDHSGLMWWPDGGSLLFGGIGGIAAIQARPAAASKPLTTRSAIRVPWSATQDGTRLAFAEMAPDTGFDLWTAPVEHRGDGLALGTPQLFLRTRAMETTPAFSPDGRWIAYASNESGVPEVFVRSYPDTGVAVKVSNGGGTIPRWSLSRRELLYRTSDRNVVVATYRIENGAFVVGEVRPWTRGPLAPAGVLPSFDLAPDGERIAALTPAARAASQQTANHATFVFNFADEVRRRVGSR